MKLINNGFIETKKEHNFFVVISFSSSIVIYICYFFYWTEQTWENHIYIIDKFIVKFLIACYIHIYIKSNQIYDSSSERYGQDKQYRFFFLFFFFFVWERNYFLFFFCIDLVMTFFNYCKIIAEYQYPRKCYCGNPIILSSKTQQNILHQSYIPSYSLSSLQERRGATP